MYYRLFVLFTIPKTPAKRNKPAQKRIQREHISDTLQLGQAKCIPFFVPFCHNQLLMSQRFLQGRM